MSLSTEDKALNHRTSKFMKEMADMYQKLGEGFKSGTFTKLAHEIDQLEVPVTPDELKGIKGIGPSSLKEVSSFLESGTSDRYKELEKRLDAKMDSRSIKSLSLFVSTELKKPAAIVLLKLNKISTDINLILRKAKADEVEDKELQNAILEFEKKYS